MKNIVPVFSIVMSLGIIIIWIKELRAPHMKQALLQRREGEHLVWPHVTIEAFTAFTLLITGIGSLMHVGYASIVNYFSLGALCYASFNSLSWTLADSKRWPYSLYMLVGALGSVGLIALTVKEIVG